MNSKQSAMASEQKELVRPNDLNLQSPLSIIRLILLLLLSLPFLVLLLLLMPLLSDSTACPHSLNKYINLTRTLIRTENLLGFSRKPLPPCHDLLPTLLYLYPIFPISPVPALAPSSLQPSAKPCIYTSNKSLKDDFSEWKKLGNC